MHLLIDFAAWFIFQCNIQVGFHYLIFLSFISLFYQRFIFLYNIFMLNKRIVESRNSFSEFRPTSFLLSSFKSTSFYRHFWGVSAFAASTLRFYIVHLSTLFLKNSDNLFLVFSLSSSICFHALIETSSFFPYFWMNLRYLSSNIDILFSYILTFYIVNQVHPYSRKKLLFDENLLLHQYDYFCVAIYTAVLMLSWQIIRYAVVSYSIYQ